VRLKSCALHRPGNSQPRKVARTALQRANERAPGHHSTHPGDLEAFTSFGERAFDERGGLWTLNGEDRQGLRRKSRCRERSNARTRPGHILEYPDGEAATFDVSHGATKHWRWRNRDAIFNQFNRNRLNDSHCKPMIADVAIVGGGPAGSWMAYRLASHGARVVLFDASHPREKPCGGGVTGRALALVAEVLRPDGLPSVVVRGARFGGPGRTGTARVPLDANGVSPASALVVASRRDFDRMLFDAARSAGAEIVQSRVVAIEARTGEFTAITRQGTHRARALAGGDGATSLVRRRMYRPFRRDQLSMATGFFAHGVTDEDVVLEMVSDPPGYIWSFPRPTHLAIGICAQASERVSAAALRAAVSGWIARSKICAGARLEPYSWPIPSLNTDDFENLHVAGPAWCLVGDAAGLVDPITREGIFFAIESAEWAAQSMLSAGPDPWRQYRERVRDEITPELREAASLKRGLFDPRFTALLVLALERSDRVRRVMADLVAGRQPYRTLKWRLIQTLECGLAWKLLRTKLGDRRRVSPR
jgi:menaquinone-9 beta-reductase